MLTTKKPLIEIDTGVWYVFDYGFRIISSYQFLKSNKVLNFDYNYESYTLNSKILSVSFNELEKTDSGLIFNGFSIKVNNISQDTISISYFSKDGGMWSWSKYFEFINNNLLNIEYYIGYNEYSSYGIKDGIQIAYYDNLLGSIKFMGTAKDNSNFGKWFYFNRDGYIDSFGRYSGNYVLDSVNFYTEQIEGSYFGTSNVLFLKKGKWRYYNEKGRLTKIEIYNEDGDLIKERKIKSPIKTPRNLFLNRKKHHRTYISMNNLPHLVKKRE